MSKYNTLDLMSYEIYNDKLVAFDFNCKLIINTINPHSYVIAKKDSAFQDALRDSDILIPDGSGIVLAARMIEKRRIFKIAGADLHEHLLSRVNERKGKCFYMGSSVSTLEKIKERIAKEYPNIIVETYSPPYKLVLSKEDNEIIISEINKFKPDVLFVGMTAPKQEKWVHQHKEVLDVNIICSIGAVFDFYAGVVERSSQFWIDSHLEWLPRLYKEPKRLWKRNFVSTPLFIVDILLSKINKS